MHFGTSKPLTEILEMYGAVKSMSVGSTVQRNEKPQGRLVIEAAYNQFSQSDDISEPVHHRL